jgi:DNA mismatch repair protein MutS
MMRQYLAAKEEYPDAILLFRMGDFYEMFLEDARVAAEVLGLTLTTRDKHKADPVPMAGIPYHALHGYLATLVRRGFSVAICEQVEDPRLAKGIVKREVVRVITPGTLSDADLLEARQQNFLAAVALDKQGDSGLRRTFGLSFADISTGEFYLTEFSGPRAQEALLDELGRLEPAELLLPDSAEAETLAGILHGRCPLRRRPAEHFAPTTARAALVEHFRVQSLQGFGCEEMTQAVGAAGANLAYLLETQKTGLPHLRGLHVYRRGRFMVLDEATRRNLELVRTIRENKRRGSLLDHVDRTVTSAGGRLLHAWLLRPLLDLDEIERRQEAVEALRERYILRHELRESLRGVHDLERLCSRIGLRSANARDLVAVRETLLRLPDFRKALEGQEAALLAELRGQLETPAGLLELLERGLGDSPPATVREGGMIRDGYHEELDELRALGRDARGFIQDLEQRERTATGLKGLKVKFNQVFGYFIELPRAQAEQAPEHYLRKQTLVNAERYITPELKTFEEKVLTAKERIEALEYELFNEILDQVQAAIPRLQEIAVALASSDVLAGLAQLAEDENYARPRVTAGDELIIRDGRHPVVEALLGRQSFVPNDTVMATDARRIQLITGPNMAGKSTYIRQVGLIVLLAQMGSFVPAREATIGLVDRIFTRVGASDSLAGGESTFMVEMNETANILNNATARSLVILDEIGRGTATFDGLSIAWATVEYLHAMPHLKCRTLFATHYHELTDLALTHPLIANVSVAVREEAGEVRFLHRVVEGAAGKSFGIQVARLAGMPREVIERAGEILENLEAKAIDPVGDSALGRSPGKRQIKQVEGQFLQLSLFTSETDQLRQRLMKIVPEQLTPLDALKLLDELRKLI